MNEGRNNTILLTVIGIATLLVAIVGATFAFFTARISGSDTTSTLTIKSASGGSATFIGGDTIKVENIYPRGADHAQPWVEKSVRITYNNTTSTYDYKYTLKLNYSNDFGTNQIKYKFEPVTTGYCTMGNVFNETDCRAISGAEWKSVTSSGNIASSDEYLPTGSGNLTLGTGTFTAVSGTSAYAHAYKLTISYPDTNENQNYAGFENKSNTNQEKALTAWVSAEETTNS